MGSHYVIVALPHSSLEYDLVASLYIGRATDLDIWVLLIFPNVLCNILEPKEQTRVRVEKPVLKKFRAPSCGNRYEGQRLLMCFGFYMLMK